MKDHNLTLPVGDRVVIGFVAGADKSTEATNFRLTDVDDDSPTLLPPTTSSDVSVTYTVVNRWNAGLQASVMIENVGDATAPG